MPLFIDRDIMAFQDDGLAPEVDYQLLRALVRRTLTEDKARSAYRLIHSFQSWNEAHQRVLAQEFRKDAGTTEGAAGDDAF